MTDALSNDLPAKRRLALLRIAVIGMTGYLLGSFLPAGYVRYLVQSKLFPDTLAYQKPTFDPQRLQGAKSITWKDLADTFDANPSLLKQKFMDKPVKFTGTIKYFLEGSSNPDEMTLTLDTGADYETGIIMTFDNPTSPEVTSLRKGGDVTATCLVSGTSSDNVHLDHCRVSK